MSRYFHAANSSEEHAQIVFAPMVIRVVGKTYIANYSLFLFNMDIKGKEWFYLLNDLHGKISPDFSSYNIHLTTIN